MAPNPDSRITLGDNQTTSLFKTGVGKLGGSVECDSWDEVQSELTVNGHHIGTTRMASAPTLGVVDANLKVHSMDNFYVAGASVFPSAGISNPTFTIIMLSIRLADHVRKVLVGG
jgi:choline dehydrogenase-like flavoprotein